MVNRKCADLIEERSFIIYEDHECHVKSTSSTIAYNNSLADRSDNVISDLAEETDYSGVGSNIPENDSSPVHINCNSEGIDEITDVFHVNIPKGLTLCSHNVNHISNKLDELKVVLDSGKSKIDVYGICETFLTEEVHDDTLTIQGYQMVRKDRPQRAGGGLLLYIKDAIRFKRRGDLETINGITIEIIWIEINLSNKPVLLAQIYKPPNIPDTRGWFEVISDSLQLAYAENKSIVLMGDLNIDLLKPSPLSNNWNEIYTSVDLEQVIDEPTRITATTQTLIDHIYLSSNLKPIYKSAVKYSISDHLPVLVTLDMKNYLTTKKGASHLTINYRDFKKFNEELFRNDLSRTTWPEFKTLDVDNAVKSFNEIFTAVIDKTLPKISKRVQRPKQPGWVNDDIRKCMKLRENAKKAGRHDAYRYYRNQTTAMIRIAKRNYYREFVVRNKDNTHKLAKLFDELSGKTKSENITALSYNNKTVTDSKEIANILNTHFTTISDRYTNRDKHNSEPDLAPLRRYIRQRLPPGNVFKIPLITEHHMNKLLKELDVSKATGLDDISARLIKLGSPHIVKALVELCNRSIETGTFPESWKLAKVIPLYKKNSKEDAGNYRPISILPVLSKLLEKHVANNLIEFLTVNDLLAKRQSGFRPKHSCETALHQMVDEWTSRIMDKKIVGLLFVDFSKAFDLVDHKIILQKLSEYNFHKSSLDWFTSYLTDRKQIVKANDTTSEEGALTTGVPQGSILGPIIFLMSINDMPLYGSLSDITIFADDATESVFANTVMEVETKLQEKANDIETWSSDNKMVVNVDKTKTMLISNNQKLRTLTNRNLIVKVGEKTVEQVSHEKLLGIQIDEALTWDDQVKQVRKQVLYKLYILRKIKDYLPINIRKLFFSYYVKPHLDYCNTVWGNTTKKNIEAINKLLKQAARLILCKDYSTPSDEMFKELGWSTFQENKTQREALLVYKALNNMAPPYLTQMFQYVHEVGRPGLRSTTDQKLYFPRAHPKSLRFSGPRIWNNISDYTRNAKSVNAFKASYLKEQSSAVTKNSATISPHLH